MLDIPQPSFIPYWNELRTHEMRASNRFPALSKTKKDDYKCKPDNLIDESIRLKHQAEHSCDNGRSTTADSKGRGCASLARSWGRIGVGRASGRGTGVAGAGRATHSLGLECLWGVGSFGIHLTKTSAAITSKSDVKYAQRIPCPLVRNEGDRRTIAAWCHPQR
jgi:hypothetical protein